jgi:iron complex outermembrane recepter protein
MRKALFSSAAAAVILTATATGASAQTTPTTDTDIVIVTAQKREENLQKVPAAVSVLSGAAIANANAVNIEGITALVPSLTFNKGGTTLNSSLFLRGVGTINFSIAAEPSVAFVLDGVVMARAGEAFGDLYDLQRLEVLRGPQGTLFGKNASAGVVNVVSKKAGDVFSLEGEASFYSDNESKAKVAMDLPLGERARSRVTAFVGEYDGNIINKFSATNNGSGSNKINGYSRWGLRAVTDIDLSDKFVVTLIADYRKADDDCCASVVLSAPATAALRNQLPGVNFNGLGTREVNHDFIVGTQEEAWGLSAQADYELAGGHTLTSITAYRSWANTELREGDFRSRPALYVGNAYAGIDDFGPQDSSTFSQELRLTSPGGGKLEYTLGAYYYTADNERTFRRNVRRCESTTLAPDNSGLAPCAVGSSVFLDTFAQATFGSTSKNFAVFGNGSYDVTEKLSLIGGLRYTKDELSFFHNRTNRAPFPGIGGISDLVSGFSGSTDKSNVSGKVGIQYVVSDSVDTYASYTTGYKGPAYNAFFNMIAPRDTQPIAPETARSLEFGLKARWWGGRVVANLAWFRAEYKNFQANSPDILFGLPVSRLTNAGDISTEGFELDFAVRPITGLRVSGGLALTEAQIEQFRLPVTGVLSSARQGERLPFAPEVKGTVSVDYNVSPTSFPFDMVYSAQLSSTTEQRTAIPDLATAINPGTFLPGFTNLDASVSFVTKDKRYSLAIVGKNLTDSDQPAFIENTGAGLAARFPRNADSYYGITLKAKFGG